jgi:hypothetical protein
MQSTGNACGHPGGDALRAPRKAHAPRARRYRRTVLRNPGEGHVGIAFQSHREIVAGASSSAPVLNALAEGEAVEAEVAGNVPSDKPIYAPHGARRVYRAAVQQSMLRQHHRSTEMVSGGRVFRPAKCAFEKMSRRS